jgi:uncharacterized repeat protein (TIGR01451 family)
MLRSAAGRTARVKGGRKTRLLVLTVLLAFVPGLVGGSASAQAAPRADMAIVRVIDAPDPVFTNDILVLQVWAENHGPGLATGVAVATALPPGVGFVPALSNSECVESGGIVTCSFSSWPANVGRVIFVAVTTPSTPGALLSTFTVTANERDPDLSNNSATETTQVVEETAGPADLSINLSSTAEGYAGQNISLGIGVQNAGPATASGVTVTLEFPDGLRPTLGGDVCTDTGGGLSCSYAWGSLSPGPGVATIVGVTAAEAGTYTLRGTVTADQTDPGTENNTAATVVTANPAADLSAQIAESADPASPGTVLTYTVTITNHGPSPASAVALTDTWSTTVRGGAQLLSFAASQGQCALAADERIDCQLGDLASGANATLTVSLRPKGTGSVTDQAQASATEFDPDTANNIDSETTTVGPVG